MSRWEASRAMFWTAMRCGFVYHVALFTFEECAIIINYVRSVWRRKQDVLQIEDNEHSKSEDVVSPSTILSKTVKNAIICVFAIFSEAIGASLGTLLSPGYGTLICDRLFSACAYFV